LRKYFKLPFDQVLHRNKIANYRRWKRLQQLANRKESKESTSFGMKFNWFEIYRNVDSIEVARQVWKDG